MKKLILFFSLILSFSTAAAIDVYEFESPEQEALFKTLSTELRCPKCQNNNIADSNASLAKDLRQKTYELIKQGKTEDEVVEYMVARFGNFVIYKPPVTPATLILWVGPGLFILLGLMVIVRNSRRKAGKEQDALTEAEEARLAKILKDNEKE